MFAGLGRGGGAFLALCFMVLWGLWVICRLGVSCSGSWWGLRIVSGWIMSKIESLASVRVSVSEVYLSGKVH